MLTESDRLTRLVQQVIELSRLQGDEPLESPDAGRPRRGHRGRRRHQRDRRRLPSGITSSSAATPDLERARQRGAGDRRGRQPGRQRGVTTPSAARRCWSRPRPTTTSSRSRWSTRASASRTDEIDRIFERFYRVDPARHRSTGGTGLGLSIVKHVAATHGGDVRVWSVEGQGSTFTLTLPRYLSAPRDSRRMADDPGTRRRGRRELQRRTRLHAAQGGLRGRDRGGRQRRAHRVRPQRRRHRAARPDAARAPRHRGVPPDPADVERAR